MKDPTQELLDTRKVRYELVDDFKLDDIDLIASVTNQSRRVPIDLETVDRYVAALQDGAEFPPILLRVIPDGTYILGGNHRVRAHLDAGRETIAAYTVVVSDIVALELSYADNARHGLAPTLDERIDHALILITKGRSAAEAARIVGVDPQRIYRQQHIVKAAKRAGKLGVGEEMGLVAVSVRPRLVSLTHDRVFVAATKAVVFHGLGIVDTTKLVTDLNAVDTSTDQIELLEVWLRRHAEQRRRGAGRPSEDPYLRLRAALATINSLDPEDIVAAAGVENAREVAQLCDKGARHLVRIHDRARAG